jgi:hypothetical protein
MREGFMDRIMVVAGIGAALVFAAGCVLGIMAMIALAARRQDRDRTSAGEPPDPEPDEWPDKPGLPPSWHARVD